MKTMLRDYQCVQAHIARHKQTGRYTRWELCTRPRLRPTHWFVLSNLRPHGNTV